MGYKLYTNFLVKNLVHMLRKKLEFTPFSIEKLEFSVFGIIKSHKCSLL